MSNWSVLPPRALAVARLETAVATTGLLVLGCTAAMLWQLPLTRVVLVLAAALLVIWAALDLTILAPRRHAAYRFRVDDRVIEVHRGVLVASELLIPLDQVLFVDTRQGPLVRLFGVTTVRIGTVGSSHDIGPLEPDHAEALADLIGRR